jgi:hypothetical protein
LFAGERFVRAVEDHGLTGFRLDLVWSSEGNGVLDPAGFGLGEAFEARVPGEVARKRRDARAELERRASGAA